MSWLIKGEKEGKGPSSDAYDRNFHKIPPGDIPDYVHLRHNKKLRGFVVDVSVLLDWPGHHDPLAYKNPHDDTDWVKWTVDSFKVFCKSKQLNDYTVVEIVELNQKNWLFETSSGFYQIPPLYKPIQKIPYSNCYCCHQDCRVKEVVVDGKRNATAAKCAGCDEVVEALIQSGVEESRANCKFIHQVIKLHPDVQGEHLINDILDKWSDLGYPPFLKLYYMDPLVYGEWGKPYDEGAAEKFIDILRTQGKRKRRYPEEDKHATFVHWN